MHQNALISGVHGGCKLYDKIVIVMTHESTQVVIQRKNINKNSPTSKYLVQMQVFINNFYTIVYNLIKIGLLLMTTRAQVLNQYLNNELINNFT